jgi:hypothetical protein
MPRRSRIDAAGAPQHVIVRGSEKDNVFRNDSDRDHFLERLGEILQDKAILISLNGSHTPEVTKYIHKVLSKGFYDSGWMHR